MVRPVDVADKTTVAYVCTTSADGNNVVGSSDIKAGKSTQSDVVIAGAIKERSLTDSRVETAGRIGSEGDPSGGRVTKASCVAEQRINTVGRIAIARCIVKKRVNAVGRIAIARCESARPPMIASPRR